jgi:hypothetical protein
VRADTTIECLLGAAQPVDDLWVGDVGLVDDDDLRHVTGTRLGEHLAHGGDLTLGVGVGAVHDVQQQIGVGDLLQRGAERLDELVRQRPNESDRVDERVLPPVGRLGPRTVGSRVANNWFSTSTPAPVIRLRSEDLPALV